MVTRNTAWKPAVSDGVLRDLKRIEDGIEDDRAGKEDKPSIQDVEQKATRTSKSDPAIYNYALKPRSEMAVLEMADTITGAKIHGGFQLPYGYDWIRIPRTAIVRPYGTRASQPSDDSKQTPQEEDRQPEVHLSASYSLVRPLIAIVQTIYAGVTLYRTRGDQLDRFGFAAFGLTVTPYLVMSIINFVAQ
jgi:hypothetical protein